MSNDSAHPLRFGLPPEDVVVIHHLSDLDYRQSSKDSHPIFAYATYLNTLEPEHIPDVIIITGNLTATGKQEDFQGLAGIIQGMFSRFANNIRQHVFVVPGMLDLNWEKQPLTFDAFTEAFAGFGIPGVTQPDLPNAKYLVYPIDTCYIPTKLSQKLLHTLRARIDDYQHLYEKLPRKHPARSRLPFTKPRTPDALALRQQYADASKRLLLSLDAGLVQDTAVTHFEEQLRTWNPTAEKAAADSHPLKILVTHHPLMPLAGTNIWTQEHRKSAADLARMAHQYGFYLALHGHAQVSQIEAAMSDDNHFFRQIGAGWQSVLGTKDGNDHRAHQHDDDIAGKKMTVFNEIVARYSHKDNRWVLDMCCKPLATPQASPPRYMLLNRAGDAADPPEEVSREQKLLTMRDALEKQLRLAMAQFSDNITASHVPDILSRPLTTVRDAISAIIFADCETRVGLAIKTRDQHNNNLIALKYRYIEPTIDNNQRFIHPFRYPLTFASWALILGRPLIYPKNYAVENALTEHDTHWITYTNKSLAIYNALSQEENFAASELRLHAGTSFAPEVEDLTQRQDRARKLQERFNANAMTLKDVYQEPYSSIQSSPFTEFIAVPVPLRPESDSMPTLQPEIGVLLVDAYRRPPKEGEKPVQEEIFYDERIEMLRTISAWLFVMLTTADKLERPQGIWRI